MLKGKNKSFFGLFGFFLLMSFIHVFLGNIVYANIDLGNDTSCGVKADGALSCWGSNSNGQAANQTGTTFLSISEGYNYSCGVKVDGYLSCWGYNGYGQVANQTGTLFQSISAGFNHTCGVKADKTLSCWGDNSYGKLAIQTGSLFQSVTTGANHTCGLKTDGTVLCWGDSGSGKTVTQTGTFTSISAGNDYTCGVKSGGSLVCWGDNSYGQSAYQTGMLFQSVSAGFAHTCGVRTDSTVWCWGYNGHGQTNYQTGVLFLNIGVGYSHSCGIKTDKSILCWGYNSSGQAVSQSGIFLPDSENIIMTSSYPVNTSTGIGFNIGTVFSATFTSNINPATLSGNLTFRSSSGVNVPFSVSVSGGTISIQNSQYLNFDTDYTITFGSGISNYSGTSLLVPRILNFRTQVLVLPQTLTPVITDSCSQTSRVCGYTTPITDTPKDLIIAGYSSEDSNKVTTQNIADPVTLSTGEFVYENTLLKLPSKGLSYELVLLGKNRAQYDGPIGYNWDHSYNKFLRLNGSGGIDYYNGKLGKFTFASSSSQNVLLNATISLSGSIYTITYRDGKKEIYGANLRIATLQDALGNSLSFTYDVDNKLTKVTDQNSNDIIYAYYPTGRIQSITAPGGRVVTFTYSNDNDLTKIDLTNSGSIKSINFTYSSGAVDPNLNHNILSFTDAKGQTYVTNTYDANDRIISQLYGNGTVGYSYTLSGSTVTKNTVTNKQGIITEYTYDNSGNNTQMKVVGTGGLSDITYIYTYDASGQKLTETKPLGNGIKYTYDGTGDLIESRVKPNMSLADSGATDLITSYQYDTKGNISQVTSPNGKVTTFTYNSGNLPTKIESTISTGVTTAENFIYDGYGRLTEKRDGENNPLYYEYSTLGLPTKIKTGTGVDQSVTTFTYDTYGNPITLVDGEGYTKTFTYDAFDRLVTDTTAEGIVKQYAYDANNNQTGSILFLTGAEYVERSTSYDILDNPTQIISEQSNGITDTKNISYNNNGKVSQISYQNGLSITTSYDMMERVKNIVTVGDQTSTITYGYDNNGNNTTINNNGNTTTKTFDLYDRVSRVTDALGNYTNYTYDKAGNILTSQVYTNTGVLIQETSYVYDLLSRVTKIREKKLENSTYRDTTIAYYKNNLKSSEIDALSGTTLYSYDTLGREISKTLPNGLVLQKTYNKKSDVLTDKIVSSSGTITTTYGYDKDSRRTSMTDNLGNLTTYSYNKLNQLTQVVDPLGIATTYTYDYLGNVLTETRAGKTTTYLYDALGRKTRVTDAGGSRTDYTYDKEGRLLQEDVWVSSGYSLPYIYTYYANGNLLSKKDPQMTTVSYNYDALDRVISMSMALGNGVGGSTSKTFTYDALGHTLSASTNDGWNAFMTYDSLGNQTKDSINTTFVISTNLLYDTLGRVTQMPYTQTIGFAKLSYDSLGRLTKTTNASNVSYVDYTYNQLSLIKEARKNGLVTNYAYDTLTRLSTISGSGYTSPIGYTYNSGSLITARGSATYQYNNLNEITKAVYPTGTYASMSGSKYNYDLAGNRMAESITLGTGTGEITRTTWNYSTGVQDQYNTITSSSGFVYGGVALSGTLLYDNAGNITGNQIGTQKQYEFVYDYANRIIAVNKYSTGTTKSALVTYNYDGLGRRAFRTAYSGSAYTERTFYGYYKNFLIEERTDVLTSTGSAEGSSVTKNYIYGPNGEDDIALVIQKYVKKVGATTTTTTTNYYYHKDHLSSPEKISNDSGAIIEEYAYTPYGATFIKNSSTTGAYIPVSIYMNTILPKISLGNTGTLYGNNRLYAGREYDKESGLYYNRARYYDPTHGRFLSRDPIGYIDDVNPYRYVGNNPMMYSDPSGLKSKPIGVWSKFKNFSYNLIGGNSKLEYYAGLGSNLLLETIEGIPQIPFVVFGGNQLNPGESVGQGKAMEGYYESKIGQEKGELSASILGSIFVVYKGASILSNANKVNVSTNIDLTSTKTWPTPPYKGSYSEGIPSRLKPASRGEKSLYDESGGQWRYSPEGNSPGHPEPHWDYQPSSKAKWENISLDGKSLK